jgi:serine/threonine protein kinase
MLHTQGKFISVREKLALLQQIISAVNWLANNYVCHRDIKPDNIMIDEHKTPKIIDFGSCCPVYGVGNDHFRVT